MQEEVDQLLLARRGVSQSLSELQARARELPYAKDALAPSIAALQEQLQTGATPGARQDPGAKSQIA